MSCLVMLGPEGRQVNNVPWGPAATKPRPTAGTYREASPWSLSLHPRPPVSNQRGQTVTFPAHRHGCCLRQAASAQGCELLLTAAACCLSSPAVVHTFGSRCPSLPCAGAQSGWRAEARARRLLAARAAQSSWRMFAIADKEMTCKDQGDGRTG